LIEFAGVPGPPISTMRGVGIARAMNPGSNLSVRRVGYSARRRWPLGVPAGSGALAPRDPQPSAVELPRPTGCRHVRHSRYQVASWRSSSVHGQSPHYVAMQHKDHSRKVSIDTHYAAAQVTATQKDTMAFPCGLVHHARVIKAQ
jgi:hypothetical protein